MSFYHPPIYRSQQNRHHLRHFPLLPLNIQCFTKSGQSFHLEIDTISLFFRPLLGHQFRQCRLPTGPQPSTAGCSLTHFALLSATTFSQQKWEYVCPTLHPFPSLSSSPLKASLGSLDKNQNLLLSLQIFGFLPHQPVTVTCTLLCNLSS